MAQPVRHVIKETHSDIVDKEPVYYTLLIDGNSLLFKCMADDKKNTEGVHYGGIYQFLLQMKMMMSKKRFDFIYVTFDNEYSGYQRYCIYEPYKANRDKNYASYGASDYMKQYNATLKSMQNYFFDKNKKKNEEPKTKSAYEKFIDENFDRERDVLCSLFEEMMIRWYMDETVEGDDLIAYYCKNKKENEKIVIMTGDMDLCQLLEDNVCIYYLSGEKKTFVTKETFKQKFGFPSENLLVKKVFCGDTSDNISNIKGLSENKLFEIIPEIKDKPITIEDVKNKAKELIDERLKEKKKPLKVYECIVDGVSNKQYDGDFYEINKKIIDLKNPIMTKQSIEVMDSMMYAPQDPEGRSLINAYQILNELNIYEFSNETKFSTFFSTFKSYFDTEKKFFEDNSK